MLAAPLLRALDEREEDFVYPYAAAQLYLAGADPYSRDVYQRRVSDLLGRENPYVSRAYASAYPPGALMLFLPIAALPYHAAFIVWNAALFLALLLIWLLLTELCAVPRFGLEGLLLAGALVSFPGVNQSLTFHRLAAPALAAFLLGAVLMRRGRTYWGAFAWGFLLSAPVVMAFVLGALLVRRRWKEAVVSSWLGALQFFPMIFGLRAWSDLTGFWGSLGVHSGSTVFFDSQSLAVGLYKVVLLIDPTQPVFGTPVFQSAPLFEILRWAGLAASVLVLVWVSLRACDDWEAASFGAAAALLGSVYSHSGDQLWLIPAAAVLFGRSLAVAEPQAARIFGLLIGFNLFVRVLSGPFRLSWYSAGYWTAIYLLGAWAVVLRQTRTPLIARTSKSGSPG